MRLDEKQKLFAKLVGTFLVKLHEKGYEVKIGEVKRTQAQADENARTGRGISTSLHLLLLAIDIELYKKGTWLRDKEDYRLAAEVWTGLHELCRAGYYWKTFNDPGHFSVSHQGRE